MSWLRNDRLFENVLYLSGTSGCEQFFPLSSTHFPNIKMTEVPMNLLNMFSMS